MKKVLFLGSKKDRELFNGYEVVVEKKVDKAIKRVFVEQPDVIISDLATTSFLDSYYLKNLVEKIDVTKNIPFAVVKHKNLNEKFDIFTQVETKKELDELVKTHPVSDDDKKNISGYKLTNANVKALSTEIMDKLLFQTSILSDIKSFVSCINDDYALSLNIFNMIDKYISYDLCGVYFNDAVDSANNFLNLSLPTGNLTLAQIEKYSNKFFDEFDKYKRIERIQTALVKGDVGEKQTVRKFNTEVTVPYHFSENMTGGIYLLAHQKLNSFEALFLELITQELELIFKLKYMFYEQAKHALYDSMTGLFNKQEFDANLEKEFHRARRYIYNFTLAFIDIDDMEDINEKQGTKFGDFVIYQLAALLKEVFRRTDLVYRYGGDKFVVFMPMTPITKSIIPIERLREKISQFEFKKDDVSTNITVSIGLCANYSKFESPEEIVNALKVSTIKAKQYGKNRIDIHE